MDTLVLEKPTTTIEELIEKLYQTEGKAEIINGEIVEFMATGCEPGIAGLNIALSLKMYQREIKRGIAFGDNIGFIVDLPHRKSFSPDAAYYIGKPTGMKFLQGAPIFAVEVRSENDYGSQAEKAIAEKRADYFAAGTEIVWDVDLQSDEVIKSFHCDSPANPKVFRRGDAADAEPVLPKWKMAVNELFD
ncbi:MAG: Uma2 family endonuclease [Acidobacteria bacterium]|jgi:Uma2 family endonuclease|nr:Uma2 family endonuclease [Acidobacteriota bacterium]